MATTVGSREGYVGEKRQLIREGYGIYHYENKFFRYEGEWLNGKKHGHGKLIMADGSYYEGEFQNGEIMGHGFKYFSPSGNTYSGEFVMGEQHGQGVMNYSNGTVYEGEWTRNRRQGYGVMRSSDNSVYQGYMHDNKRHGEGTQIYSDGERYDGDWVNDMRQGHGELRKPDGTVYDGQWRNDVYNGQGTIVHASGVMYEGLWINGFPAKMGCKLAIRDVSTDSPLEVTQGSPFTLDIITINEEGEFVEENGRELHIWAGYKYTAPKEDKAPSTEPTSTGLFDMIEDVEEKPHETPFGYSIVGYPLVENYNVGELSTEPSFISAGMRQRTDLSEAVVEEEETREDTQVSGKVFGPDGTSEAQIDGGSTKPGAPQNTTDGASAEQDSETVITAGTELSDVQASADPSTATIPHRRTTKGLVSYKNLVLPAPPPMYRPFVVQEAEEEKRSDSRAKGSRQGRRMSVRDEVSSEKESRPSTKAKKMGDERFARPGDYVIVVEETTTPPFLSRTLEPIYLQVHVSLPATGKKSRAGRKMSVKAPSQNEDENSKES